MGVTGTIRLSTTALSLAFATACSNGAVQPSPALEVVVSGRLERGLESRLELRLDGEVVPDSEVVWSVIPAGGADLGAAGTAVLLQSGELTFTATTGVQSASLTVTVGTPPLVLFDRLVEGNRDIWVVALDGADQLRLTTHVSDDSDPSGAAGVATFVSYRNGNADLYTVPIAGGPALRLTNSPQNEVAPSMTLDGRRVAYTREVAGLTKLWTLDVESGVSVQVGLIDASDDDIHASPNWWASSDSIAFVTTAGGSADIRIVNLASGTAQVAVAAPSADVEPAISPDGSRIVFVSNRDGNDELYVTTLATGATERLTNRAGSDANPAWLADGRIVYSAVEGAARALCWLDPEDPTETHRIPGTEGGGHPSGT